MNHADHVHLLHKGVPTPGGVWADIGSGDGAFTLALRDLIGPDGAIYSIDQDRGRLDRQQRALRAQFPQSRVHFIQADFTRPLALPPLDGLVMANALHFFRQPEDVLRRLVAYLRPGGRLILVEYNVEQGNLWVPHPVSFPHFQRLAAHADLTPPELLATRPSSFLREFYSALAFRVARPLIPNESAG